MRTKELADVHRKLAENAGPVLAARCLEVAALLDRLHAIESASGEEVAAIRERHDARQAGEEPADYSQAFEDAHEDRATLLAIVQRQGAAESSQRAEIAELSKALDCARAEIRRQVGEVDNLKTANAALAAENARLVNEVGALAVEPIPIEETHAEYIARLRKDVEDRRLKVMSNMVAHGRCLRDLLPEWKGSVVVLSDRVAQYLKERWWI